MLCVTVLALPRSGSSLAAGVLHHLGVPMGARLMPANDWNRRGFFEDVRFVNFHNAITRASTDPRRRRLNLPDYDPHLSGRDLERYHRLVMACEGPPCWGVKDPQLLYYFDAFRSVCRDEVRVVSTLRPDDEIIASMLATVGRARQLTRQDADDIVTDYREKLEDVLGSWAGPKHVLDYRAAIADPAAYVADLARFVGVPVTAEAVTFVAPELHHNRGAGTDSGDRLAPATESRGTLPLA